MSGNIALIGTLLYVLAFAIGVGPVPGILVSEINAAAIRGRHAMLELVADAHIHADTYASACS
jgi:Sugar (and other) transporter